MAASMNYKVWSVKSGVTLDFCGNVAGGAAMPVPLEIKAFSAWHLMQREPIFIVNEVLDP